MTLYVPIHLPTRERALPFGFLSAARFFVASKSRPEEWRIETVSSLAQIEQKPQVYAGQISREAARMARARVLRCSVEDLEARDQAVEAARPKAKAEAARLGITEEDYLEHVGDMEVNAREEARFETMRDAEHAQQQEPDSRELRMARVHSLPLAQPKDF